MSQLIPLQFDVYNIRVHLADTLGPWLQRQGGPALFLVPQTGEVA